MSSSAMPSLACSSFSSFRICAWMVTSSAVVGSSAISRSGSLASAMAIITRWRWPPESSCGIGAEPLLRLGEADQAQQLERARARRAAVEALVQEQHLADLLLDRVQRVQRGHRLLEDHARCGCRGSCAASSLGAPTSSWPWKRMLPLGMPRQRIGQQLQDRERGHRLARAALADQRQGLALAERRSETPRTALTARAPRAEGDAERSRDLRAGGSVHAAHCANVLRGSKASRTASPMKTSSVSISAMTTKPVMPSHGACRLFLPCVQQLAERRRARRQAEAEEVERRSAS